MCENCPKSRMENLSPYTHKLIRVRTLRDAGYPLKPEDLDYEEWLDLARIDRCLEIPAPFKSRSK